MKVYATLTDWRTVTLHLMCLVWCAVLSGCSNPDLLRTSDILALNKQTENKAYVLGPGDTIAVKLLYNNELNDEVVIRTDGKVSLQPLGDVTAAGLTLQQLDELLTSKYTDVVHVLGEGDNIAVMLHGDVEFSDQATVNAYGKVNLSTVVEVEAAGLTPAQLRTVLIEKYSDKFKGSRAEIAIDAHKLAEVTVMLKSSAAQKAYIGGEVSRPGMIPIAGMLRVTDALFQAGGHKETSDLGRTLLIRHNSSASPNVYELNLSEIMRGKMPDIRLKPYDVIFIPRTAQAEIGMFIQSLIPIQFNVVYNLNPEITVK